MARKKNIAIDDDVYESLLDIGSKRDTFSDIIRKCIDAYKAFQQGSRTPIGRADEHYEESDRQSQPQNVEPVIHSSRYQTAKSGSRPQQPTPLPIPIELPGIEFPANRSEILKRAEEANIPKRVNYLKFISNREYKNKLDLKNELLKDVKNSNVDFMINTEKLRKEQHKEKILEQERQTTTIK